MKPADAEPDLTPDPELQRWLDEWAPPAVPGSLDTRVQASFRALTARPSLARRFLTASVRVPLPVAVAALLLLGVALWSGRRAAPPPAAADAPAATQNARIDASQAVVTRTRLAGFEPVHDMNVTVIPPNVGP